MMIAKEFHLSSLVVNMKIYYIDDSMLSKSEFATQVLTRFEFHLKKEPADLILISAGDKESPLLKHFIESQLHIPILVILRNLIFKVFEEICAIVYVK